MGLSEALISLKLRLPSTPGQEGKGKPYDVRIRMRGSGTGT
jgi:hypothetical protein